jgi:putative peptidoglycan lipid II flippase
VSIIEPDANFNDMVNKYIKKGKDLLVSPQSSILSAASVVMLMVFTSRVLGLIRQRILADFFAPNDLSAAFRLPDIIFEVLVFGTFSSAFIPVFTKSLKRGKKHAWDIAGRVVNIGLIFFAVLAVLFSIWAKQIYSVMAPGFNDAQIESIAAIARIIFLAQGFFVISYVLTGVLESLRRFLVPALAPIFYNLGIILGTIVFTSKFGLKAPAFGVVMGAFAHFLIQIPLATRLGFRFSYLIKPNSGVKKIGKLALPRIIDLSFDQIGKTVELYLASFISTASYTYFTFANSLQLLPVTLFGTSLAKAALPTFSRQESNIEEFRKTFLNTIFQAIFFTAPLAVFLIVLRVPIVRLVYGTDIFDWKSTVQTGMVLSAFAVGVVFQTLMAIISRAFFALHDTKTPVVVSMAGLILLVIGDFILVTGFNFPVWALAASFSFSCLIEAILLYFLMNKRINGLYTFANMTKIFKIFISSVVSGLAMYVLLKFFDQYAWVKRLSFLQRIEGINFQKFVLDTRYTVNLLILTVIVSLIGTGIYLGLSILLRIEEVRIFFNLLKRILLGKKFGRVPSKEQEPVAPTTTDRE